MNRFEHRLHQIEILINAYNKEDNDYSEEINKLETERTKILLELKYDK